LRVGPTLAQIQKTYGDKVRIVWKNLPLDMHKNAMGAALAAAAAAKQGKFWEFHDKIFENQQELGLDAYKRYATELGMDVARFEKDLADPDLEKAVDADKSEAQSLGVTGTPAFFVNGRFLSGAQPFDEFARVINAELTRLKLPVPPGTPTD
jgi:protein-disulfide isomerase